MIVKRAGFRSLLVCGLALAAACGSHEPDRAPAAGEPGAETGQAPSAAVFDWFTYSGSDPAFEINTPGEGQYQNPILAGFYPDPSITQVGGDYYLVNSTFCYFPGIPVWHSTDLVNWTQIGNVIDRPGMLDFDGLALSRGVFAPTIAYHEGTFYVANTCVDCGGNFIVTATDPAGPWSDPVWLPDVGGIDPSLFFDEDGTVWLMNNDAPPEGSTYDGHRAIWIRRIDPDTFQPVSEPVVIINGGVRPEEKPIWIEGPHIYKVNGWYYLSSAEGGTAVNHSQVIARSRVVTGPYEPWDGNPILTQRDMPEDRPMPITSVGHADYVQDADGQWWAVFLGVRPYEGDYYNTGRETFMLPVTWTGDGWPVILPQGEAMPYTVEKPGLPGSAPGPFPTTGNFTVTEAFDTETLPPHWLFVRIPAEEWWTLKDGALEITPRPVGIGDMAQPSLIARRQQHLFGEAETEVSFTPSAPGDEAGLVAFQNDAAWYALGITLDDEGTPVVRLRMRNGDGDPAQGLELAADPLGDLAGGPIRLKITARGDAYDFAWAGPEGEYTAIAVERDGRVLSTRQAGGFVGAVFGLYAEAARPPAARPTAE